MEKQTYKKLEIRLITLANEDVITASGKQFPTINELIPDWN